MNHEQARQFIRALFHFVWEKRDASRVEQFYSPDLTGFSGLTPISIDNIYQSISYIQKNLASNSYSLHDLVLDGNRIAIVMNGKFRTIDNRTEYYNTLSYFFELDRGKIIKMRVFVVQGERTAVKAEPVSAVKRVAEKVAEALGKKKPKPQTQRRPAARPQSSQQSSQQAPAEPEPVVEEQPPHEDDADGAELDQESVVEVRDDDLPQQPQHEADITAEPEVEPEPVKKKATTKKAARKRTTKKATKKTTKKASTRDAADEQSGSQYSASPDTKFTFGKTSLQFGVNPADHKSDD